jgi:hypothetical protein
MVKKSTATGQRFSMAAKQARAAEREARELAKAQREKMLDESIVRSDIWDPASQEEWAKVTTVALDGRALAFVLPDCSGTRVGIMFGDLKGTELTIQNVDACKPLLTFRKVAGALMVPNGIVNLANLVRQRDAQAEAEQLRAFTDSPSSDGQTQVRSPARL